MCSGRLMMERLHFRMWLFHITDIICHNKACVHHHAAEPMDKLLFYSGYNATDSAHHCLESKFFSSLNSLEFFFSRWKLFLFDRKQA